MVTVNQKAAEDVTTVPRQSISVFENRKLQDVTGWVPLRGPRSGLQLVVLLDDSSRGNLGLQLNDIKSFLAGLPPTTQVAIGYMRNGTPNLMQKFTSDHAQAAKSLRLPSGTAGINGSPYFCLSDLVKHWPGGDSNVRREVIMVTDGVDRYSGGRFDPENPYVRAATSDAQKAGVIVYSIYYRGAGRFDQSALVTDGGQNYLTQVSGDTGGKVYLEGFGNPVSFRALSFRHSAQTAEPIRVDVRLYSEAGAADNTSEDQPAKYHLAVACASSSWRRDRTPVRGKRC